MFGVLTLVASIYVLSVVPEFLVRFCLWLLTHTIYRIRIDGQRARARRAARRCSSAITCRTWTARSSARASSASSGSSSTSRTTSTGRSTRCCGCCTRFRSAAGREAVERDPTRARQELAGRPRRLHLRGRGDQPHRQPAAVQARPREDRRRPRRPDRPGLPGSRVGQRVQLQGRTLPLEAGRRAFRIRSPSRSARRCRRRRRRRKSASR